MTKILVYLKDPERGSMRFERLSELASGVEVLQASSLDQLPPAAGDADVLITIGPHLGQDAETLYNRLPRLEWVQSIGTGVDNIKGHAALPDATTVTNVRGVHGPQLSEAAFAAMLIFSREIRAQFDNQAQAVWRKMPVSLLHGKVAAILGIGAIARDLASRCDAFGMRVIGISSVPREEAGFEKIVGYASMGEALEVADFLVVLTPYSAQTRHILGGDAFARMKAGSYLINLARGGVVDEAALLDALAGDRLAGAAVDVFEIEPLPSDSPFWSHPKVVVTPHSAGFHAGYPEQAFGFISRNLQNYLSGGVAALENKV